MSNNGSDTIVLTDVSVLKALSHPLRRDLLKRCWKRAHSVGELAGLLDVNPGTVLYHMRRLAKANLIYLEDTEKKRGIVEKRYRSRAKTISVQMRAEEATEGNLAPLVSAISKAVRSIDPACAARGRTALVGHVAEARISMAQQREITKRLAELALWIESLTETQKGTPMRFAAIFGPTGASEKPERQHGKP